MRYYVLRPGEPPNSLTRLCQLGQDRSEPGRRWEARPICDPEVSGDRKTRTTLGSSDHLHGVWRQARCNPGATEEPCIAGWDVHTATICSSSGKAPKPQWADHPPKRFRGAGRSG
jgi:hypothetical protein